MFYCSNVYVQKIWQNESESLDEHHNSFWKPLRAFLVHGGK